MEQVDVLRGVTVCEVEKIAGWTDETIDWDYYFPHFGHLEGLEMCVDVPIPLNVADASWQSFTSPSGNPLGQIVGQRAEEGSGWVKYNLLRYDGRRTYTNIRLELLAKGSGTTTLRLWLPSMGPGGANRRSYSQFDQRTVTEIRAYSEREDQASSDVIESYADRAQSETIAYLLRKVAHTVRATEWLVEWFDHAEHAGLSLTRPRSFSDWIKITAPMWPGLLLVVGISINKISAVINWSVWVHVAIVVVVLVLCAALTYRNATKFNRQ